MPRTTLMNEGLYEYVQRVSVREPEVLAALRAETRGMQWAGMQIGADQGQFMRWLVRSLGVRRCLEVGVFTGYSSLSVALALPDDGEIVACDVSEEWTAIARKHWKAAGVDHKIRLELRPAVETLDALLQAGEADGFDFAFIDADKESYDLYYERCLRLVRPGGVIAFDNVFWGGSVADPENTTADTLALRALNDKLGSDERVEITMLAVGDGLTLARRKA